MVEEGDRIPVQVVTEDRELEKCASCEKQTSSGIYKRVFSRDKPNVFVWVVSKCEVEDWWEVDSVHDSKEKAQLYIKGRGGMCTEYTIQKLEVK